jgi:hypothetical protein
MQASSPESTWSPPRQGGAGVLAGGGFRGAGVRGGAAVPREQGGFPNLLPRYSYPWVERQREITRMNRVANYD